MQYMKYFLLRQIRQRKTSVVSSYLFVESKINLILETERRVVVARAQGVEGGKWGEL